MTAAMKGQENLSLEEELLERQQAAKPEVKLTKNKYAVGLSWDSLASQVDIDLQAVIVDNRGLIVDAIYYNNLSGFDGAIEHTGDEETGDAAGMDEMIWLHLDDLPAEIGLIIFIAAAYDFGSLNSASNGQVVIFEEFVGNRLKQCPLEDTYADVDPVMIFRKGTDGWYMQELIIKATEGCHFLDIIEPTIGSIIRSKIRGAPKFQKVSFAMDKGHLTDFPMGATRRLLIGIGAYLRKGGDDVDIDVSALFLNSKGKSLGTVDGKNTRKFGCTHSGDQQAGVARKYEMDDEAITIDVPDIPDNVQQIFFILTLVKGTFRNLQSTYARVCDQSCHQLARYDVNHQGDAGSDNHAGMIIGRLVRSTGARWAFQALGKQVTRDEQGGWKGTFKEIHKIFGQSPDTKATGISNSSAKATKPTLDAPTMQRTLTAIDLSTAADHEDHDHDEAMQGADETQGEVMMKKATAKRERLDLLWAAAHDGADILDMAPHRTISRSKSSGGIARTMTRTLTVGFDAEAAMGATITRLPTSNSIGNIERIPTSRQFAKNGRLALSKSNVDHVALDDDDKAARMDHELTTVEPLDKADEAPIMCSCCRVVR